MIIQKRQHPRALMPWVMEVVYELRSKRYRRTVLNLSAGGMFIQSRRSPPDNCELKLSFEVDGKLISCLAHVVHSRADVGFGVLFVDLAESDRALVRDLVERVSQLVGVA